MTDKSWTLAEISNQFADIVAEEIDSYAKEVTVKADNAVKEAANLFKNDLQPKIPVSDGSGGKNGHLQSHIRVSELTRKGVKIQSVNFAKKYRIVHLLEYGWTTKNGTLVRRTPFIRPTFESNKEKYFNKIKENLKG